MATEGYVYLLSNEAMPGLVKIGKTSKKDVKERVAQLFSGNTSVPLPFEIVYAARVNDIDNAEKSLHIAFDPDRIYPKREFFKLDAERVIAILKLIEVGDATVEVLNEPEPTDVEVPLPYVRRQRPRLNFREMQIPIGAELRYIHTDAKATVKGDRTVDFEGEEFFLTTLTQRLMGIDHALQPTMHWMYDGRNLIDIYNETYPLGEE